MGQSVAGVPFVFSRCAQVLALVAVLAGPGLAGCDALVEPGIAPGEHRAVLTGGARTASPPAAPMLEAVAPRYPAAVVYILYREYLHRNPGLTRLSPEDPRYQRHMEKRLRELYPGRGYAGMMRDAVEEARRNREAWLRYERELREYERRRVHTTDCEQQMMAAASSPASCSPDPVEEDPASDPLVDPSWEGQEEFEVPADSAIPTIEMEIDTLQLEGVEVDSIYYYESLAEGTFREPIQVTGAGDAPTIDDLIRAAGGSFPDGGEVGIQVDLEDVSPVLVSLGVIGWKAHRAIASARRAIRTSDEAFGFLVYYDTKRDAMRHVFWSMMLRRYVGAFLAKQITDHHERDSSGPGLVMDLHNNDIGRSHRYRGFRGDWLWDRWNWRKWGGRVRDYIYYSADNGVYIPEWLVSRPTTEQAWQREATVPDTKYIYFRQ